MTPQPLTLDFETLKIEARPAYPPVPIGVSLKEFGQPAEYMAWGHASNNNTTKERALKRLKKITKGREILCHSAKFDLDVLEVHCDIKLPAWQRVHDTMWLLFLHDPNLKNLGLKPSAEELLGWPSDEQEAVRDWLLLHQPVPGVRISPGKKSEHYYMKYLAYAPGDIVGRYADGDVERTEAIFHKIYPLIEQRGMLEAYDRERRLMPVLLGMERRGVRVDLPLLRGDVAKYQEIQTRIDAWLRKKLNVGLFFNLDSDAVVDALIAAGFADRAKMGTTPSGKTATNKAAIAAGVTDPQGAAVLKYRAQLHTCMATFMEPWLKMAEASGGFVYSTWNQVRGEGKGARTGRLSSSPNFQNIPKIFDPIFLHEAKGLPRAPLRGILPLPTIRRYVVPYKEDHVLIDRDYSQQELRIMAHFGDGVLLERYRANVWMDAHEAVKGDLLNIAHLDMPRGKVKTINFGIIYGMGFGELANRLDMTVTSAKGLKKTVIGLYPEIGDLYATMRQLAKEGNPLITWGGRENLCETPIKDKTTGRTLTFDYKMVNTLIQGSAGDATKEAMIRYAATAPAEHLLLLQVHDQLLVSVPRDQIARGHRILRDAMESLEFDVEPLSEGKWSKENWASLAYYDKTGVVVADGLPPQTDN